MYTYSLITQCQVIPKKKCAITLAGVKLDHHKRTIPQCSLEFAAYFTQNQIMILSTKYAWELQNGALWDCWDLCFSDLICISLKSPASRFRSRLCKGKVPLIFTGKGGENFVPG